MWPIDVQRRLIMLSGVTLTFQSSPLVDHSHHHCHCQNYFSVDAIENNYGKTLLHDHTCQSCYLHNVAKFKDNNLLQLS